MQIRLPGPSNHVAPAGRTGSGKTVAMIDMIDRARDVTREAVFIVDHKRDKDNFARLPAERYRLGALSNRFLPERGLHLIQPRMTPGDRQELEELLMRCFRRGKITIYIDEGHLMGVSEAVRTIMVAGRSQRCSLWWTSQRAHWIDTFIWSQASFYRCFQLQTKSDEKRFEEHFPVDYSDPGEFQSFYYDVAKGWTFILKPSRPIEETIITLDEKLRTEYRSL